MNRSGRSNRVAWKNHTRLKNHPVLVPLLIIGSALISFECMALEATAPSYWEEEYWQQSADYEIRVTLDDIDHTLTGSETVTYRNNSPDTLDIFHMHLYPNAYRERTSPLIRDYMQGTLFFIVGLPKWMRGWIDVTELRVNGVEAEFDVEGTILTSSFQKPLLPGQEVTIDLKFEEKVRRKLGRAGYVGNHYDIAQWYPKMVVYDKRGWHPDQFRMGEFYGEFGNFNVHITLPEEYVVAATGIPVSGDPGWDKNPLHHGGHRGSAKREHGAASASDEKGPDLEGSDLIGTKTIHFRADRVHDFAWVADPTFIVQDTVYNDYRIMSFFRPWNRSWADTVLARGLRTMQWLESIVGPYPYPQVSIVDSPTHGGMEYPMLAMNGSPGEALILHEVGHNYFYGILANDERAEAWLDEGFTQYQTFLYAEKHHGPYGEADDRPFPFSLFPRRKMWDGLSSAVIRNHRFGFAERVATPHHEFKNGSRLPVYIKSALFLRAIHYTVGDEVFRKILHAYFDRWKFKHVDEEAFLSVCEEVSEMDLGEIFKQWLHTTKNCDYKIDRFKVRKTEGGYSADLKIERKGELMMPLTLAFRLENGNTVTERVDGLLRTIEKSFPFDTKPVRVAINPENEIMDIYQADNYAPRRRKISLDVPFNDYHPPDAYEFRMIPIGYYNDIDGAKAGLRLRSGYDDTFWKFTLQGLYGFESGAGDFYGSFEHPLRYIGREASLLAEGYYREGRQGCTLVIDKVIRKYLSDPLAKYLSLRFAYQELTDSSYVYPYTNNRERESIKYSVRHLREETKQEGERNIKAGLDLSLYPTTDLFSALFSFSLDRSIWGSVYDFEKSSLLLRLWPARRYPLPIKPYLRFFLGYSSIDPPMQERFNLAGAGVLKKERYFWLRSVGAFPKDYYNNFHVPGEGNLRGYYNGDFSFKRLFASNAELEIPFPLPIGRRLSRTLNRRLYMFFDWGKVLDASPMEGIPLSMHGSIEESLFDEIISDFGAGVKIWRITAEFPLYISHPVLTGDKENWERRWTIGFKSLF